MQNQGNEIKHSILAYILLRKVRIKLITGDINDVEEMLIDLNDNKEWMKNQYNESVYLMLKGEYYRHLGDYNNARDYYLKAAVLKQEIGDETGYASCIMNIGTIYQKEANYIKAVDYYDMAKVIYKKNKQSAKLANARLNKMSVIVNDSSNVVDIDDYSDLESIFKKMRMFKSLIVFYEAMSKYYSGLHDYKTANTYIEFGMNESKRINDIYSYANQYLKRGVINYYAGHKGESIENFKDALAILENYQGYLQLKVLLNYNIADVYNELDDKEKAYTYYQYVYANDSSRSDMYDEAEDFLETYTKEEK